MANQKKRSSLSEVFGEVAARRQCTSATRPKMQPNIQQSERGQVEMVPTKGGRMGAASTPVIMTFTVTAKESYKWSLEFRRLGMSVVSMLREVMNELLVEGKSRTIRSPH